MALRVVGQLDPPSGLATVLRGRAQKRIDEIEKEGMTAVESACRGRGLVIAPDVVEAALVHVTPPQQAALESLVHIHRKIALRQYETLRSCVIEPTTGVKITQEVRPVPSMAVVAPGTWDEQVPHALLSVLAAARVAGVPRRAVLLEPDSAGGVSPVSILAAGLGEATDIYRTGGVPGLVALSRGWLGFVPEKTELCGGSRLVQAAGEILHGRSEVPAYDMLVLTDSTSGVQPVLEILSSWLADDPFSTVGFLTTSRRLVQRMETHLDALPEPRPAWTRDLAQIPVVVRQTVEEMITASSAVRVKYLVLLVSKPEQYIPQIFHASHIVLGDNAAALISRRAFAAGVLTAGGLKASCETTGVFSFLRSVTIEKIGHKTAERLKVQLNQLTKS
ncbi:histidinol dehydrogenase [Myxococcota bacterium]|nr:histidinol dehydrogenase [Myxococcota bacterium]MBU1413707.1 histidinol dehydrogenase [Myxococcota bacterium]MBU1509810.1 histidinol dehydrogenase [Myxococcota bacterium]PKN25697.1 MAG: hypothetical protein CVU65_08025 [Deltaproteobacteria bacterium HGW-Deltaproteobacteria-22]